MVRRPHLALRRKSLKFSNSRAFGQYPPLPPISPKKKPPVQKDRGLEGSRARELERLHQVNRATLAASITQAKV